MFLTVLQNLEKNTGAGVYFLMKLQVYGWNLIEKPTPTQVFSCENLLKFNCKIDKNTYFTEQLIATASDSLSGTRDFNSSSEMDHSNFIAETILDITLTLYFAMS